MTRICPMCNTPHHRLAPLCQRCYLYNKKHPNDIPIIPRPGEIIYSPNKNEIRCHVCGRLFAKPLQHAYYVHNLTEKEYRARYQFYNRARITGTKYHNKMHDHNQSHHDVVVEENLLHHGTKTRFQKGQPVPNRGHHIRKEERR